MSSLGSYIPKPLAERIITSKAALEGERNQVQYLLTGFLTCDVAVAVHSLPTFACTAPPSARGFHRRRGDAICTNGLSIRQDVLDHAVLAAISETLDERVLDPAV